MRVLGRRDRAENATIFFDHRTNTLAGRTKADFLLPKFTRKTHRRPHTPTNTEHRWRRAHHVCGNTARTRKGRIATIDELAVHSKQPKRKHTEQIDCMRNSIRVSRSFPPCMHANVKEQRFGHHVSGKGYTRLNSAIVTRSASDRIGSPCAARLGPLDN